MRWIAPIFIMLTLASNAIADPFRPSIKDQIKLGKDAAAEIRKTEKVLKESDPRVQELRRLGQLVIAQIPEKERKDRPFEYTFDVIDSKELNAFALPGGPIFFYTGLLDKMKTEDEVMGILAHEIVHIRNQHWASQYADTMKRKVGLGVLLSVLGANQDILNATDMLDDILVGLKYSRKHENESDRVGYDLMVAAGYNPQGMIDVFQILLGAGGDRPPEILSTHPDTKNRIDGMKNRIAAEKRTFPTMRPRKARAALEATTTQPGLKWQNGWPILGGI
jgi:predicted Zn-dependent protease